MLIFFGSLILTLSAKIQTPYAPVPTTMQTFAVLLLGMFLGYKLATITVIVYLIEGMNQCAGIHALHLAEQDVGKVEHSDYVTFVTRVDNCKFRNPVFPGNILTLKATLVKRKMSNITMAEEINVSLLCGHITFCNSCLTCLTN